MQLTTEAHTPWCWTRLRAIHSFSRIRTKKRSRSKFQWTTKMHLTTSSSYISTPHQRLHHHHWNMNCPTQIPRHVWRHHHPCHHHLYQRHHQHGEKTNCAEFANQNSSNRLLRRAFRNYFFFHHCTYWLKQNPACTKNELGRSSWEANNVLLKNRIDSRSQKFRPGINY